MLNEPPWALLSHAETYRWRDMHERALNQKRRASFNLWSFVSGQVHYENLHSDVIQALLDPRGAHGENALFLELFIRWLQQSFLPELDHTDFREAVVEPREAGRIDVLIRTSKHAILIENKLNDAVDQDRQLDRYAEYAHHRSLTIQAILYLSLDGAKKAPRTEAGLDALVCNAAAFSDCPEDMVNGWLIPCQEQARVFSSKAFVAQYISLLQSLAHMSFDQSLQDAFYQHLSEYPTHLQNLDLLVELRNALPDFRARRFGEAIKDYRPFKTMSRWNYKPYWVLQSWAEGNHVWKLDIIFEQQSVIVVFWEPSSQETTPSTALLEKLDTHGLVSHFPGLPTTGTSSGVKRVFHLGQRSLADLDAEATQFVKFLLLTFCHGRAANSI